MTPTAHPLSPALSTRLDSFERGKAAYIEIQQSLTSLAEGNQQISQKVSHLEAMVEATEASWKGMARKPEVEQAQINADIERCAKLRDEASALRMTADVRSGLQTPIVLQLAEARQALVGLPGSINADYWKDSLAQILGQDGLRESLLQAFVLTRALYLNGLKTDDSALLANGGRDRDDAIQKGISAAFANELMKLFKGAEADAQAPLLATLPAPVKHEVVVTSPVGMRRLREQLERPLA